MRNGFGAEKVISKVVLKTHLMLAFAAVATTSIPVIAQDQNRLPEMLDIVPLVREGRRLDISYTPVLPSFSPSRIALTKVGLREVDWNEDAYEISGVLLLEGVVESPIANSFGETIGDNLSGKIYINGSDDATAIIPTAAFSEFEGNDALKKFSYQAKGIKFTEGLNTVSVLVPDPLTGIGDEQLLTVEIQLSEVDGVTAAEASQLKKVTGDEVAEVYSFSLYLKGLSEEQADDLIVILGPHDVKTGVRCGLKALANSDGYVLTSVDTGKIRQFVLIPNRDPNPRKELNQLGESMALAEMSENSSPEVSFLVGYSLGLYAHGADLLGNEGVLLKDAARVSTDSLFLELPARWEKGGKQSEDFPIKIPTDNGIDGVRSLEADPVAGLMWHISDLYRRNDPLAEEVGLALLTSDYESIGTDIQLQGWNEYLVSGLTNSIESFNEGYRDSSPYFHGYTMGLLVAVGSQKATPPRPERGRWERPLMSSLSMHILSRMGDFTDPVSPGVAEDTALFDVPEKYEAIWPSIAWFYYGAIADSSIDTEIATILPDEIKHPVVPVILVPLFVIGYLGAAIWFLVEEFKVSIWWGLGQRAANFVSCLLVVPGVIVALVFLSMNWKTAKKPFLLGLFAFAIGTIGTLMIPSWAVI